MHIDLSHSQIKTMKNTHLEHPEDCLLTSREDFMEMLRFLRCIDNTVSVKYDGAPAIVWGIISIVKKD